MLQGRPAVLICIPKSSEAVSRRGRIRTMVRRTESELRSLWSQYEAAFTAYQASITAISRALRSGEAPTKAQKAETIKTLEELNQARTRYQDALFKIAFPADKSSRSH